MRSTWKPTRCAAWGLLPIASRRKPEEVQRSTISARQATSKKEDRNVGDLADRTLSEPVEEQWVLRQAADGRPIGKRQRQGTIDAERGKRDDDNGNFDRAGRRAR